MSDNTKIEWTDATVNAVNGCSVISPGCKHCYAMKQAHRFPVRQGLTRKTAGGMVWTGEVRLSESALLQPLRWKRPRRIFWNAHGDLFHENVPDAWIDRVFAVCALTPQHTHQILTKRSARMRRYLSDPKLSQRLAQLLLEMNRSGEASFASMFAALGDRAEEEDPEFVLLPLPNVWLGVSIEDRERMLDRAADLKGTPAAIRFWSGEPLLGDLGQIPAGLLPDWVIVGGESGPGARPMHPDWARRLRDQCAAAGVPFFFKQWGDWESSLDRDRDDPDWRADYTNDYVDHGKSKWLNLAGGCGFHGERFHVMRWVGKRVAGRLLDGIQHDGMPA